MKHRICHLPLGDLAYGWNLEQAVDFLTKDNILEDINTAFELYNISLYFNEGAFLKAWTEEQKNELIKKVQNKKGALCRYANSYDDSNIVEGYLSIDENRYVSQFWGIFEKNKFYKKISPHIFQELLSAKPFHIETVLCNRNIVNEYKCIIRDFLLSFDGAIHVIMKPYKSSLDNKIYIPDNISLEDKEEIANKHISETKVSSEALSFIQRGDINFSQKTRLRARKKEEELIEQHKESCMNYECNITCICRAQNEPFKIKYEANKIDFSYSEEWISQNLSFSTILNNFIYLFEYVNDESIINLCSTKAELSFVEKYIFNSEFSSWYKTGVAFGFKFRLAFLQMFSYCNEFKKHNIRLEAVIEWFFSDYLKEEFNIKNFIIQMPTEQSSFFEKCHCTAPLIEAILKQYDLYVKEGEIDHELLEFSTGTEKFQNIGSLVQSKYAYVSSEKAHQIMHMLFSDQTNLTALIEKERTYNSFCKLLIHENPTLADFQPHQMEPINFLIKEGIIKILDNNKLTFSDTLATHILFKIYNNESINVAHYANYKDAFSKIKEKGFLTIESSLLTRQEASYFNYFLNKAEFTNGYDLRNIYAHGIGHSDKNEEKHKQNYFILLHLIILLVIKINNDLCLHEVK